MFFPSECGISLNSLICERKTIRLIDSFAVSANCHLINTKKIRWSKYDKYNYLDQVDYGNQYYHLCIANLLILHSCTQVICFVCYLTAENKEKINSV